jgi:hypothetical protein
MVDIPVITRDGVVDDDDRHFSARGNLGQFIYIIPEDKIVIVRHG